MRSLHLLRLVPPVLALGFAACDAHWAPSSRRAVPPAAAPGVEPERDGPGILSVVATALGPRGANTGVKFQLTGGIPVTMHVTTG